MIQALADGFRAVSRTWGLGLLLLAVNLATAMVLAAPLAGVLEEELAHREAALRMDEGFDYSWWSEFADRQSGFSASFGPELIGTGFAFRNLDLLLRGWLPAGLFVAPEPEGAEPSRPALDAVVLALGVVYLIVQTFLAGGILGVMRAPQGGWTVRGLLHGSGFYFGRMARATLVALAVLFLVFLVNRPLTGWAEARALEAVSEGTAQAWLLGRHAALLLVILAVNMVSTYAKTVIVLEERASAVLAFLSALSFCARRPLRTFGHYLALAGLALALLLAFAVVDRALAPAGWAGLLPTLALAQALVLGRIFLRLALMGGQVALYRRLASE